MFDTIEKRWDERAMEGQSMRAVFLWLISCALVLGAGFGIVLYDLFHLQRLNWYGTLSFVATGLIFLRYGLAFYRRLGR
jgi:hypothetical protein